jgi:hypothetical protein
MMRNVPTELVLRVLITLLSETEYRSMRNLNYIGNSRDPYQVTRPVIM